MSQHKECFQVKKDCSGSCVEGGAGGAQCQRDHMTTYCKNPGVQSWWPGIGGIIPSLAEAP